MAYGLPWCGTSEISTKKNYPLGGFVFLKQAHDNHVFTLASPEKAFMLMQRLISPVWDAEMQKKQASFCESITEITPVFSLHCTKDPAAAETMKHAIDQL